MPFLRQHCLKDITSLENIAMPVLDLPVRRVYVYCDIVLYLAFATLLERPVNPIVDVSIDVLHRPVPKHPL